MSKNPHPYLKSNEFQRIFHRFQFLENSSSIYLFFLFNSWVASLLKIGRKRPLEIDDVFDILPDDESTPWTDRLEK